MQIVALITTNDSSCSGLRIPRSVASKHGKVIRDKLDVRGALWEERAGMEREEEVVAGCDLNSLTEGEVSALITAEDELSQSLHWSRIYPTPSTSHYSQFWSTESHHDRLLQAWEERYGGSPADREEGRDLLRGLSGRQG